MTITSTRNFRCLILRRHHWMTRTTDDGNRYETCSRCGRDQSAWPGGGPLTGLAAS